MEPTNPHRGHSAVDPQSSAPGAEPAPPDRVLRKDLERTIVERVAQTRGYMDRCAAEAGHLVVFDRTPTLSRQDLPPPGVGSRRAGHRLGDVAKLTG